MTVQASLFDPTPDVGPAVDGRPTAIPGVEGIVRHQLARGAWVDLLPGWVTDGDLLERLLADVPWHAERRPMYDRVVDVPRLLCHYGEGEALPHPALETVRDVLNARYEPELGEPLVTAGLCLYRDGADSVAWHGDTIGRGRTSDTVVAILSLGSPREFLLRPRGGGAVARAIAGADLGPTPPPSGSLRSASEGRSPSSPRPSSGRGRTGVPAQVVAEQVEEPATAARAAPASGVPATRAATGAATTRAVTGAGTIRHTLHHGDLVVMGGSCQRTWEHAVPKTSRSVGPRVSIQFRPRGVS